jgi:putative cell wall-binding protein
LRATRHKVDTVRMCSVRDVYRGESGMLKKRAIACLLVVMLVGVVPARAATDGKMFGEYYVRTFIDDFNPDVVDVDAQGNVYVAGHEENAWAEVRIRKYSPAGGLLLTLGDHGTGHGQLESADDIAVDGAGNIFVLDEDSHRVNQYGPSGAFITEWNSAPGIDPDKSSVTCLAVDASGYVYVGEIGAGLPCVRKFKPSGQLVASFGTGGQGPGQFDLLKAIAFAPNGDIYTVEYDISRVQRFTAAGKYVTQWAVPSLGPWAGPDDVEVGPDGNVYVWADDIEFDWLRSYPRLLTYSPSGTLLSTYDPVALGFVWDGEPTDPDDLTHPGWKPRSMAIHSDGTVYVVSEFYVYSFGTVPDPPANEPPQRVSGAGRYDTAVAISKANFKVADTVVIATGENFPDALSGSGLCGAYRAPLLLTRHDQLPAAVLAEVSRLGAKEAFIIGGAGVVNDSVKTALVGAGLTVRRLGGTTRYQTAALVAAEIAAKAGAGFGKTALVARGDAFPDALALAPFAYSQALPILLVRPDGRSYSARDSIAALGVTKVLVAGGTAVVPPAVVASLGVPAERAGGTSRYDTAVAVAKYGIAHAWGTPAFVGLATGANFPDALAGGPGCGANGGVMLMTRRYPLDAASAAWLSANKAAVTKVQVYGGPGVVSAGARLKVKELLGW